MMKTLHPFGVRGRKECAREGAVLCAKERRTFRTNGVEDHSEVLRQGLERREVARGKAV